MPTIGVLALQGAFGLHTTMLGSLGVDTVEVRRPHDLAQVDALVIPGGESSTISMLLERSGLFEPIAARLDGGMAALGTCAGAILLGAEILDGRDDQRCFSALDISVRRNAYGRQVDSFECRLDVAGIDHPMQASFIRAPIIERVGPDVEVAAEVDGQAVVCMHGPITVATFHPELNDDPSLHAAWLANFI